MGPNIIDKCIFITMMAPKYGVNLWELLEYHIGSMKIWCHQALVWSKTTCTRPSWVPNLTCAHHRPSKTYKPLEVSWFSKFQKIFTQDLCFGTFFLPKWDFWLWGIKMILMVPGAILAMFQKLVPRCGPKMEIVLTLVSVLGPKVPWWTLQTTHKKAGHFITVIILGSNITKMFEHFNIR